MPHNSRSTEKYRPDIDGLRAIAVSSVLAFHAFPNIFKGGFVGVDIFFVISGFLITQIIVDSLEQGRFSYLQFYIRRVRRIFPALIVVVVAALATGWYVLLPDEFERLGKHLASGAGFAINFVLWNEAGYFDQAADTKPLLHLWSLAVEEQFYILWPLVLGLMWRRNRGIASTLLVVGTVSFIYSMFCATRDPVAGFYSPLSRFWELMCGGFLAHLVRQDYPWLGKFGTIRGTLGLGMIAASVFGLNSEFPFPGYWALLPTMGAFLVISAGSDGALSRFALGNRLMVGVGLVSYPLYLWHWPILVFAKIVNEKPLSPGQRIEAVAAAVALAYLTYRFIERPLRRSGAPWTPRGLIAAMAAAGAIGLVIFADGFGSRLKSEHVSQILAAAYDWQFPPVASEGYFLGDLRYFKEPSDLDSYTLFVGDSHMEQYSPRIDAVIKSRPAEVNGAIMVGNQGRCTFLSDIMQGTDGCPAGMAHLEALINDPSTHAIAIALNWERFTDLLSVPENATRFTKFQRATAVRKRVFLILDTPNGEELSPANMFAGSRLGQITVKPVSAITFDFTGYEERYARINRILAEVAERSGAILIDPIPYLCPQQRCPIFDKDGKPLYTDGGHLTRSYAAKAATYIDATLVPSDVRKEGSAQ